MQIHDLSLMNFRNYERLDFRPSKGLNVLFGMNAQGKSAILEAVYMIATSKSHRTSRDLDLIRIGENLARVCAEVERSARNDVSLEVLLSRAEKKTVKINTVKHERIGDLVGQLNAVIFSSADIDMVRGEPSLRRRFLNLEVSQVSPQYVYALGRYKRVLNQRNNLLREIKLGGGSAEGLEVWDGQLAAYGATVMKRRAEFVDFLSQAAARIYGFLTDGSEELSIAYKPSAQVDLSASEAEIAEALGRILSTRREVDLPRATTTVGPHRDDISISIAGLAAREFASQGQQRTAAVALKLAEIDLMEDAVGESPVVLLDDVTAELDELRRARVLEMTVGRCQTLVTTTHLAELSKGALDAAVVFEVRAGTVNQR